MRGAAARAAIDPAVLTAFLDERTTYIVDGVPARRTRRLNGRRLNVDIDARIMRRWRSGRHKSVTVRAAENLLTRYGLEMSELQQFAHTNGHELMLRGSID